MKDPNSAKIEKLQTFLELNLVGEALPKEYKSIIGDFVLESTLRPGSAMEDLTFTLIKRCFKDTKVVHEPNGHETFPDLELRFSHATVIPFEVKSKNNKKNSSRLASIPQLILCTLNYDFVYWDTYYVVWEYSEKGNTFLIKDFKINKLWELAGRDESNYVALERGGTRSSYIKSLPDRPPFKSEMDFLDQLMETISVKNIHDFKKKDLDRFYNIASEEIEKSL